MALVFNSCVHPELTNNDSLFETSQVNPHNYQLCRMEANFTRRWVPFFRTPWSAERNTVGRIFGPNRMTILNDQRHALRIRYMQNLAQDDIDFEGRKTDPVEPTQWTNRDARSGCTDPHAFRDLPDRRIARSTRVSCMSGYSLLADESLWGG